MTNDTLAFLLHEMHSLPDECLNPVTATSMHDRLDEQSPFRASVSCNAELFLQLEDGAVAAGGYFCPNGFFWDLHLYTFEGHRRRGLAELLFRSTIIPWLQSDGRGGDQIITTASGPGSEALLKKLGFEARESDYSYVIPSPGLGLPNTPMQTTPW